MEWCHDPVLGVLRREPPARGVRWDGLVEALARTGCRLVETEGFHLSVEWRGRLARFQHAVGTARGYQLVALRELLEAAG